MASKDAPGWIVGLVALWCGVTTAGADDTLDQIKNRIEVLEREAASHRTENAALREANARRLNLGGYVDFNYTQDSRDNLKPGFRVQTLALFFEKMIRSDWRFFAEIEYEDAPAFDFRDGAADTSGKLMLEAVHFDYNVGRQTSVRGGRYFTPAGIWSDDHYPPNVPTQERPLHLRRIFPQLIDGIALHLQPQWHTGSARFDVYVGNGEGNADQGKEDDNSRKSLGGRGSFIPASLPELDLGASFYNDRRADNGQEIRVRGIHGKWRPLPWTLQAELARAEISTVSGMTFEREGYYAQALYDIVPWILGARYDYYDSNGTLNVAETRRSVFLNYPLDAHVIFKLEHHRHDYSNTLQDDYHLTVLSVAYAL